MAIPSAATDASFHTHKHTLFYSMKLGLERAVLGYMEGANVKSDATTKAAMEELVKKGAYGAVLDQVRAKS